MNKALIFGSPEAKRQLEIDQGKRIRMSVWTDEMLERLHAELDAETYCTVCGGYMDWLDCWQCGGDGEFDLYDEDPINYSEGEEYEQCDVCQGKGGYWVCASLPHDEEAK